MSKTINSSKKVSVLTAVVVLAAMIVVMLLVLPGPDSQLTEVQLAAEASQTGVSDDSKDENTIASAWQWETGMANKTQEQQVEALESERNAPQSSAAVLPFTEESVYQSLHAVKLDDNGDIILDDDALNALNSALDHNELTLDGEALAQLQDIIRRGLPGSAGEQTAQIVADYYQYLGAKNEFNSIYEATKDPSQYLEGYEAQYQELSSLRELYLGSEASTKLFASSDANALYMFESKKLEANTNLSEEEKKLEQAKIIEQHAEQTTNVDNWNVRYQAFLDDKQYILNASLSDEEKRAQLSVLMRDHFSDQELEYVSHLELDSL